MEMFYVMLVRFRYHVESTYYIAKCILAAVHMFTAQVFSIPLIAKKETEAHRA